MIEKQYTTPFNFLGDTINMKQDNILDDEGIALQKKPYTPKE
jgi:hypothetical protein